MSAQRPDLGSSLLAIPGTVLCLYSACEYLLLSFSVSTEINYPVLQTKLLIGIALIAVNIWLNQKSW
jgi:hypothetical protein